MPWNAQTDSRVDHRAVQPDQQRGLPRGGVFAHDEVRPRDGGRVLARAAQDPVPRELRASPFRAQSFADAHAVTQAAFSYPGQVDAGE